MFYDSSVCCLVSLLVLVNCCAADTKNAGKSLAEQIAAIKKISQVRDHKFYDDLRAAKNDNKKIQELNDANQKSNTKQAAELKALIKAHAKDPAVFDGFLVMLGELRYYLDDDLLDILKKHHVNNPKMGRLCFELMYRYSDPSTPTLLADVAAKHPQKEVRGQALYGLGVYHLQRIRFLTQMTEADKDKEYVEAGKAFAEVAMNYAAAMTPDGKATLGKKAGSELIRIKNVPNLKVGKKAPEIVGEDMDGKPIKLSDYRGKVVLLDFWGHW